MRRWRSQKKAKRSKFMLLPTLCIALILSGCWWLDSKMPESSKPEIEVLQLQQQEQLEIIESLYGEVRHLRQGIQGLEELRGQMQDWLDAWEVKPVEITGYAPLDPRAVEGMCYSGDPNVTSSGEKTTPGTTVAAPADIAFGTRVYVEGAMRVVKDRGGRVQYSETGLMQLDLCVETQEEALYGIGRREALAVIER